MGGRGMGGKQAPFFGSKVLNGVARRGDTVFVRLILRHTHCSNESVALSGLTAWMSD